MIPEYLYKGVLLVNDEISLYEELPLEFLAGFFYQIHRNDNGILSNAMYHEIKLIERIAIKGVSH